MTSSAQPTLPATGLPRLTAASGDAAADALVVGLTGAEDSLAACSPALDEAQAQAIAAAAKTVGASVKAGSATALPVSADGLPALVVAVGLGEDAGRASAEDLRRAAGSAARAVKDAATVRFALPAAAECDAAESATQVALGAALGAYRPHKISADDDRDRDQQTFEIVDATEQGLARAAAIAEGVCLARGFVNLPPNLLYPETFAGFAADLAGEYGVECEVLGEDELRERGFGGLCGVGGGSARGPRLVRLSHRAGAGKPTVALVGKGITFDTGGISIKPAAGMEQMTMDMGGAAAVIGTVLAAAKLGVDVNVEVYAPMAENMPDGSSYRPGDVLTMYGGTTCEITNTDAEGRLILADAITLACESTPDYLIDTATLTGAQMVALGKRTPGVMGDEEFRNRVARCSTEVGENGWAMPLPEELRETLDSKVADLKNSGSSRWGGMMVAAAFLRDFVSEDVQWAHIDVAGPAYNDGSAYGYLPYGGTGVPVRTMLAVLEDIAAAG